MHCADNGSLLLGRVLGTLVVPHLHHVFVFKAARWLRLLPPAAHPLPAVTPALAAADMVDGQRLPTLAFNAQVHTGGRPFSAGDGCARREDSSGFFSLPRTKTRPACIAVNQTPSAAGH